MNDSPTPQPGRARLIGFVAVAVLLAGVSVAIWKWELALRPKPAAQAPAPVQDPVSDDVIRHALGQSGAAAAEDAGAASTEDKERWVDTVPGVDLDALDPVQRERFLVFANAQHCDCGCGYTLAGCRNFDPDCDESLPRVEALFDSVSRGLALSTEGLRTRPLASR
jgi:hypothetical protein